MVSYGGCVDAVGLVTRVDPDKALSNEDTYASIADTGTEAIIIDDRLFPPSLAVTRCLAVQLQSL